MKPPQQLHIPVLLEQTIALLNPQPGQTYLDLTAGRGGHAQAIAGKIGSYTGMTLVDRDRQAIDSLESFQAQGAHVIHKDFASAAQDLASRQVSFDMVLLDLGVSSPQLDNADRGFSFANPGPLDMRMDQTAGESAADAVNTWPLERLTRIIRDYADEPRAPAIAKAIVAARTLQTTDQLAAVVAKTYRGKWRKTHPATRTFQAIRIAINDELGQLEQTLAHLPDLLKPGGRVAVISFHSLEDRLVKLFFKEHAEAGYEAELSLLTKKPISGATEDVHNPRARSAKLRAAVKIKTERASSHGHHHR